jgi:hypothetical protein
MGGSVFVNVVVALGTEPVLASRSAGGSCASGSGAWATMTGSEGDDAAVLTPHSVESTPSDTDWMVVVAGVRVGGSAAGEVSPTLEPWPSRWVSGVSKRLLGGREFAAESGIVDLLYWTAGQCMVAMRSDRVWWTGWEDAVERCAGCCMSSLALSSRINWRPIRGLWHRQRLVASPAGAPVAPCGGSKAVRRVVLDSLLRRLFLAARSSGRRRC